MKRRSQSANNQPPLKKSAVSSYNHTLQSKIATKLESLFNGFVSDLQNISKEKKPDLTVLFDAQHVSNFVNGSQIENKALSKSDCAFEDNSTLALQNFIYSAKSRISELLNKAQTSFQESNDSLSNSTHETFPQDNAQTVIVDPLQIQISLKVQSLLHKALGNQKLTSNRKSQNVSSRKASELQDLSQMLQDFMILAKQKLSVSLSKGPRTPQSVSVQAISSGSNSSWKGQFCRVPQATNSHSNRLLFASSEPGSNAQLLKQEKENLNFLSRFRRPTTSVNSSKMYSPHLSDSDESSTFSIPKADMSCSYGNGKGGMLLLEHAERAPEYLDLEIEEQPETDSDEEVIVLGEKRPTYEEITLEDEDEAPGSTEKPEGNEVEEFVFNCPKCEKVFRVESLLNFHVRMHGTEDPTLASASKVSLENSSSNSDKSCSTKSSKSFQSSTRKEKENKTKSKSKSSSQKRKSHREKRHKKDKKKNICRNS